MFRAFVLLVATGLLRSLWGRSACLPVAFLLYIPGWVLRGLDVVIAHCHGCTLTVVSGRTAGYRCIAAAGHSRLGERFMAGKANCYLLGRPRDPLWIQPGGTGAVPCLPDIIIVRGSGAAIMSR